MKDRQAVDKVRALASALRDAARSAAHVTADPAGPRIGTAARHAARELATLCAALADAIQADAPAVAATLGVSGVYTYPPWEIARALRKVGSLFATLNAPRFVKLIEQNGGPAPAVPASDPLWQRWRLDEVLRWLLTRHDTRAAAEQRLTSLERQYRV